MKVYLKVLNLQEVVEVDDDPPPLKINPTMAQIRICKEMIERKPRVFTCINFKSARSYFHQDNGMLKFKGSIKEVKGRI